MKMNRRSFLTLSSAFVVAGCASGNWRTDYIPAGEKARNWRLAGVDVTVPNTLTVSEDNSVFVPAADIVWQEEDPGDRRAQVRRIMTEGITAGARGLSGSRPVRIKVEVAKFHALNKRALYGAPANTGVENIIFVATVVDANTGEVLDRQTIFAEFEGLTGATYQEALNRGESQRDRIVTHVARTTAGWLGLGADNRRTFVRMGG